MRLCYYIYFLSIWFIKFLQFCPSIKNAISHKNKKYSTLPSFRKCHWKVIALRLRLYLRLSFNILILLRLTSQENMWLRIQTILFVSLRKYRERMQNFGKNLYHHYYLRSRVPGLSSASAPCRLGGLDKMYPHSRHEYK